MLLELKMLPDAYETLVKTARQAGQAPEAVAAQWLTAAIRAFASDPVEQLIGAFNSHHVPDWVDQHDQYIGNSLLNKLQSASYSPNSDSRFHREFEGFTLR
jgi:hypothetical protein